MSILGAVLVVWRREGWRGVARRIGARLGWPGLDPLRARLLPPDKPELISIGPRSLEAFAAGIPLRAAPEPLVSVLVRACGDVERTLCCLAALVHCSSSTPFEVLVVDDGSTDATPDVLPLVPNVVYQRNETPRGLAISANRAARTARGRLLLLLDNDTEGQPGALDALVAALEDPEVGIAGSKIIDPYGRLWEAGAVLRAGGTVEKVGLGEDPRLLQYDVAREVDHCSGASSMIRRDLFLELGGFDETDAASGCEDCDLSLRVRDRGRKVVYVPRSVVVQHPSVTTTPLGTGDGGAEERRAWLVERWGPVMARSEHVRAIAFYLPQYHPIPENDAWWGKGFTEWTNVARAKPAFPGHAQPRVPADLGFYDLRLPEVRVAQADLAARYGLAGFCYYYYWFHGKRLLERPILEMLTEKTPNFPFCICWANENWTQRWDGREDNVLIGQQHSPEDDRRFLESLLPFFADERYLRVDGRPLLLLYRPRLLPDVASTTSLWRQVARGGGAGDLYLAAVQSIDTDWDVDPRGWGFDAAVEFPPHGLSVPMRAPSGLDRSRGTYGFFDYARSAERFASRPMPAYPLLRTAMPSWDNSPRRRQNAHIFLNESAEAYGRWLEAIVRQTRELKCGDQRIVFINAWNEWAEGNYLEPDQERGHSYLEATRRALTSCVD